MRWLLVSTAVLAVGLGCAGLPVAPTCAMDTLRCTDDVLWRCDAAGQWDVVTRCADFGTMCDPYVPMCVAPPVAPTPVAIGPRPAPKRAAPVVVDAECRATDPRRCRGPDGTLLVGCSDEGEYEVIEDCLDRGELWWCDDETGMCVYGD